MRRTRKNFWAALLAVLVTAAIVAVWLQTQNKDSGGHGDTGRIVWIMDHDQGLSLARETGRPAMLFFTAPWCGYCRKMIHNAFSDDALVLASSRVVPIFIDVDQHPHLMDRYLIRGVPSVYFLSPGGEVLHKLVGERDARSLVTMIDQVSGAR